MLRQTREVFSVRLESLRFARVLSVEDELFEYEWRNPSGSYYRTIWAPIDSINYLSWGHVAHEQMTRALAPD